MFSGCSMQLTTSHIKLGSFLKAVHAACSGGEAKLLITDGRVSVNGETERQRGRKLYPGDQVTVNGVTYSVQAR
jgi:ribosome-associated protein